MSSLLSSISIKRKPKGPSSSIGPLNQPGSSQPASQIFRPLTPEATRKVITADKISEPTKTSTNDQAISSSSASLKESEADTTILDSFNSTTSPGSDSKASRSPRSQSRPALIHRESLNSFHDRSGSVNSDISLFAELVEAPMVDQEDIIALTHHVRAFSEALSALRNTFFELTENPDDDPPEVKAHERLAEVLSILKGVLNQYQPLHSTDILAAAGTLINKVKSHNYDKSDKAPEEFCESIDQLALAFSSSVSDFLMGDQDMPISASREHSRSLEDFADDDEDDDMDQEEEDLDDEDELDYDRRGSDKKEPSVDKSAQKAVELDKRLIGLEHGVDLALQRTKVWSKYAKDISAYMERRAHLEQEFTNKLSRLAQATRAAITEDRYLPFQSIYVTSLDQDIEYAENCTKTYNALMTSKFLEPLQTRRTSHERKRKELKEKWTKAYKKLNEAIGKLEKAKQSYFLKQQEMEKFKSLSESKEGQESSASLTRTQKKKQEDLRKADEAEDWYKQCVSEANVRQRELMKTKNHVLVELRQLIYQCDQTMKAVTCNFFHLMNQQSTPAPIRFQCLEESSRAYEPGSQFSDFVFDQLTSSQPTVDRVFTFEPYQPNTTGSSEKINHTRSNSENRNLHSPTQENSGKSSPFTSRRSLQTSGNSHPPLKVWGNNLRGEHMSDAESTESKSAPVTPEGSPVSGRRNNRLHQTLDDDSSDDSFSDKEPRVPRKPKSTGRSGTGPFQNCRMSSAAQTHKLKKLRAPSKCRNCDSYVYFNGAECSDCGLTCHRKCLARLKNRCDKKLNGPGTRGSNYNVGRRMTTFGVDFNSHLRATQKQGEYVPYIVSHCVDDINSRGLQFKGIYRVCGVKSKVEQVCQIFENSSGKVDLEVFPPHVVAAVLKLYLRQLPEPLLTFKLFPEFIKIAKNATQDEGGSSQSEEIVRKLREVVVKLPKANFETAAKIIRHLKLVAENEEDNQMSACNLGIVFGPTLLRPRESANSDSVSMPSLVNMPHQTKTVELLINNPQVFDEPGVDDPASQETPVEEFSSVDRDKNGNDLANVISSRSKDGKIPATPVTADNRSSLLSIPVSSKRLRKSSSPAFDPPQDEHDNPAQSVNLVLPVEPDEPVNPVDPIAKASRNKLGSQITPVPRSAYITSPPAANPRNDIINSPSKANERAEQYAIPEFLLPVTTGERRDEDQEDDKDVDDSNDDSTQGTSGSRTPDDELNSSRGSLGRDGFTSNLDSQMEEVPVTQKKSRDLIPKSTSEMSLVSIDSSAPSVSASFGSDAQDDRLLPDFSDAEPTKQEKLENFMSSQSDSVPTKSVDDLSVPNRPRPGSLGLMKRNSDLPGMMSRLSFFPPSSKTSDPKESIKQSTEPTSTSGTRKHPGISDALRDMHVIYDPLIANADRDKAGSQASIQEEEPSSPVSKDTPLTDTPIVDVELQENQNEPTEEKEWYMSDDEERVEADAVSNALQYQLPSSQIQDDVSEELEHNLDTSAMALQEKETDVSEKNVENEMEEEPESPPLAAQKRVVVADVEGKALENTRNQPSRVSVKDRLKQYESPERSDSARRTPSPPITNIDISYRKQAFENSERESSRRSRDQRVATLDSLTLNKKDAQKPKEPAHSFRSRKVDIPFENTDSRPENKEEDRKKTLLTSTNSYPLRSSPKQSRRSPRRQFPDDSTNEDREPQFV